MDQAWERSLTAWARRGDKPQRLIHPCMPPVVAALAGALAGAVGATAATIIASVIVYGGLSLALGFVTRLIVGQPKMPSAPNFSDQQHGLSITMRQAAAPHRIIYGQRRVGGIITYMDANGTNNQYLDLVINLAGHECEEIGAMYFDGVEVPLDGSGDATGTFAGLVHVEKKLGAPGEEAFAGLISNSSGKWTSDHRWDGSATVYVRLKWNDKYFPNGLPNITFLVKGRKLFDPRNVTSPEILTWSDNWALCVNDYVTADFGGMAPDNKMDDASTIASANISDEDITVAGSPETTVKRYRCNGVIELGRGAETDLNALLAAGAGYLIPAGRYQILAGAYRTPTLTLTDDDCRGPMMYQALASKRDLCNAVKGVYVSPEHNWETADFPPYLDSAAVTQDGGQELWDDIQLEFTTDAATATRLAKIYEKRNRYQGTLFYKAKLKAWQLTPGDTVYIQHPRFGDADAAWNTGKIFEVLEVKLVQDDPPDENSGPVYGVDLTLRETDSSIFDWTTGDEGTLGVPAGSLTMPTRQPIGTTALHPNLASNQGNFAVIDSIDAGTDATIQIHGSGGTTSDYTRRIGGEDVTRPYGTVTGKAYLTNYHIVYDGSAYLAFTSYSDTLLDEYEYVGFTKTCGSGGTGGSTGGGGSGGSTGCVEFGTQVVEPEGSVAEVVPCEEWVTLTFEPGTRPLVMHPSTLVKVWKRADELTAEDRIATGEGQYRTGAILGADQHSGAKVVRNCPGREYKARCGEGWVELHNKIAGQYT